jgi:hypothetical protein
MIERKVDPGSGGGYMNAIVARILLFFAYASIIIGTLGWVENSHSARGFSARGPMSNDLFKITSQFP